MRVQQFSTQSQLSLAMSTSKLKMLAYMVSMITATTLPRCPTIKVTIPHCFSTQLPMAEPLLDLLKNDLLATVVGFGDKVRI